MNIFYLWSDQPERMTKYPTFQWKGFANFENYALNTGDVEFLGKIQIIKEHKHDIPSLIGKKHALKRYDQFFLNTSFFCYKKDE